MIRRIVAIAKAGSRARDQRGAIWQGIDTYRNLIDSSIGHSRLRMQGVSEGARGAI